MGLPTPAKKYLWTQKLPILVRAMVLAPDTLFLAGPPDFFATDDPAAALAGTKGGTLIALSTADGSKLAGRRQNKTSILPKRGTVTYFSIASEEEIGDCPPFPPQLPAVGFRRHHSQKAAMNRRTPKAGQSCRSPVPDGFPAEDVVGWAVGCCGRRVGPFSGSQVSARIEER